MGHFLNDLTAGCWFNYLLFFLKTIVKTSAASTALLSGQLCDGIATPIVGYLSDKSTSRFGTPFLK
jgi:Na+/melibiose symporter-like transporter